MPRQLRRTPRTSIDARSSVSRGPTTRSSFARWIDLRAGEGVVFFHGQRRPTFFGRKTIGSLLRAEVRETSLSETLIGERREPRGRSDHRSFRFASLGCF